MLSSGVQVMTGAVITWETGSASSFGPCSVRPRTMSRSEIKPRTVFPSSLTTRAPMPFSFRSHVTVKMVVLGGVVATLDPLDFRIDATFMMRPSHPDASVGDALVALGRGFTRSIFYSDPSKRHSTAGLGRAPGARRTRLTRVVSPGELEFI